MNDKPKELEEHSAQIFELGCMERPVYLKEDVDAAIAELKAENERLKKCEIWMIQHFYCEEVIACESAKNRKLKRALYKACANWADVVAFEETEGIGYDNSVAERWRKMERKCLKKAEEFG